MTEKKPVSILLMDDEIESPVIQAAVQYLQNQGFAVDTAHTMSEAIEAYYQRYYDVFILDIDMSMIPDDQEGDGINVLKRFISLHNQTRVIMYSAAGRSPHWVAAANAHCFAYVHKAEPDALQHLTEYVRSSLTPDELPGSEEQAPPAKILLAAGSEAIQARAAEVIRNTLGWEIETASGPEDASAACSRAAEFGAVVVLQPEFKMRLPERQAVTSLMAMSPLPQVIVGCEARDAYQSAILTIANHHPFRLLDLAQDDWPQNLASGLAAARTWYGRREIFQADPGAIRRLNINLPDDILDEWTDEDMDSFLDDPAEEGGPE